ncbi:MAG TPA: sugar phosphate isomerase/epimerase family protein [Phycisphaerae bacterium]|jgi:L-ribulose-5-phosphate 3-epimerase|nr:sugar phosphate isomerase/epimerase [Phycisphaerae bacterium]HOB72926.1 sugar phosphate isomerase/epimerase family protein [Phycisphaerae bacterium]HOJ53025.1 sugar phosphate isomerase/epimerase family protein [Phycisphaerae bacterium]HOL24762.1 sugar phosphate isomerase/epimerase family protein [Phycisphaerae bacterium]HPP19298.1 sugar phosphate isomerase/epimerase family protein [Phycisphaerae bacterium]
MQPLQIGVCNWSLQIPDLRKCLLTVKEQLGLKLVHLGFFDDSYKDPASVLKTVEESGLEISATCVAFAGEDYSTIQRIAETGGYKPDSEWEARYAKTLGVADITKQLGVELLSVHIGFVPHDKSDPKYGVMVERLKRLSGALAERGLTLVMETGQEKAEDLVAFMDAVGAPNLAVNFDPANMILYGVGDPVEAIGILKDRIAHVHMKDANWSKKPTQEWGEEVVLGSGEADIPRVVSKLRSIGYRGALSIEREAGNQRIADILEGKRLLESLLG